MMKIFFFFFLFLSNISFAQGRKGPNISYDQTLFSDVKFDNDNGDDLSLKKKRTSVELAAPVATIFDTKLVVLGDFIFENRQYRNNLTDKIFQSNSKYYNTGLALIPQLDQAYFKPFAVISRYGLISNKETILPMGEYIIGFDYLKNKYSFFPDSFSKFRSRILIRERLYPGRIHHLLLFEQQMNFTSNLEFVISIPSHVYLTLYGQNFDWALYFHGKGSSFQFPQINEEEQVWLTGHTISLITGYRHRIVDVLFVAIELGVQSEHAEYYDYSGDQLFVYDTDFSPYGKVAIETWIN